MQNWQFYLHMLALCVIILLLYLFFREYRLHHSKTAPATDAAPVVAPSHAFPAQTPLSHAHIQAIQSMAATSTTRPGVHATASNRFETESNLDRELSSEINDLCATQEVVDDADSDAGSSPSNSSASSHGHVESANGSPIPKVIEFVPKKKRRSVKLQPT